jgi:hypothetical protein
VLGRFGRHPLRRPCDDYGTTPDDYRILRDLLVKGVHKRAKLTKHFLQQGGWDFFGQVFSESHCVGHQCWHLHDPSHPGYDAETAALVGDPIRDVYVAIDTALRQILAQIQDDTMVVILASHRMAHYFGLPFLLPDILCRLGVAVPVKAEEGTPPLPRQPVEDVLSWGWRRMPAGAKNVETARTQMGSGAQYRSRPTPRFFGVDPRGSDCFILFNGAPVSGLRLNVRGREPEGRIEPGAGVAAFCERLRHDLLQVVEVETGKPVVKSVRQTADLYQGEYLDRLPDLLIEWNSELRIGSSALRNTRTSRVRVTSEKIGRGGVSTVARAITGLKGCSSRAVPASNPGSSSSLCPLWNSRQSSRNCSAWTFRMWTSSPKGAPWGMLLVLVGHSWEKTGIRDRIGTPVHGPQPADP